MLADCACGVDERVEEGARGSRAMKTVKPAVVAETAPQWRGFACVFASRQARSRGKRRRTFCTPSQQERVELQPVHCRHGLVSDASVISSFVFHTGRRRLTFWCFGREVPLLLFFFVLPTSRRGQRYSLLSDAIVRQLEVTLWTVRTCD